MKKKILFLASLDSIHALKWINYFSNIYDVTVISLKKPISNEQISNNIKIYVFDKSTKNLFNILDLLFSILFKNLISSKPDILHVHYLGFNALIAILLKIKFKRTKYVSTIWGSDLVYNKKNFFKRLILKFIFKFSTIITTDAQFIKKELIKEFMVKKDKIKHINFVIDINFFKKKNYNNYLAKKYSLNENEYVILSLRAHKKIYDITTLLKAIAITKEKIKIKCLIYGNGPLTEKLKENAKDLNIDNHIIFLGRYDQKILPDIFSIIDLYVSTSLSDAGISSSTAEAMACKIPCAISDNSDNNKWITNKFNGFIFPNSDYLELSKIFLELPKINRDLMDTGLER